MFVSIKRDSRHERILPYACFERLGAESVAKWPSADGLLLGDPPAKGAFSSGGLEWSVCGFEGRLSETATENVVPENVEIVLGELKATEE